jgi:hypothetical protein
MPIRTLSIGATFRLFCGTRTVSTGVAEESILMLDESVDIVAALSVCWLCVGVGAAAPVPNCEVDESVVVDSGVAAGAGVGSGVGAGVGSAAGVGAGVVVTSPPVVCVDVLCAPSFETRM